MATSTLLPLRHQPASRAYTEAKALVSKQGLGLLTPLPGPSSYAVEGTSRWICRSFDAWVVLEDGHPEDRPYEVAGADSLTEALIEALVAEALWPTR